MKQNIQIGDKVSCRHDTTASTVEGTVVSILYRNNNTVVGVSEDLDDFEIDSEFFIENVKRIEPPRTANSVRYNFDPDETEINVRRAVHVLYDVSPLTNIFLAVSEDKEVFVEAIVLSSDDNDPDESFVGNKIVATPRPRGTIEYMVCNGPSGNRTRGESFYRLREALARFDEVVKKGWAKPS